MTSVLSGIHGEAKVMFGGKIVIGVGKLKGIDTPNVILGFKEINENHEVGALIKNDFEQSQVVMGFNKIESIECFMRQLERAKYQLQEQLERFDKDKEGYKI